MIMKVFKEFIYGRELVEFYCCKEGNFSISWGVNNKFEICVMRGWGGYMG